jgi:hypothetical protein
MSTAGRSSVVAGDVPVIHPDATIEIIFLSDIEPVPEFCTGR